MGGEQVPSHLFEYFFRTPDIVAQWARHYITNEKVPLGLIENALLASGRKSTKSAFQAIELQTQILHSAADQVVTKLLSINTVILVIYEHFILS